ncbi:MAG: nucleotidyl transferase AbiEii/AbiGii toxin family protein [Deltaproteobacteria bacterium]|nr:nucleotidyl transferase AbiEii/AbiGii toxin family protein [Deltaproteobacteria bacterium]
MKLGLLNSRMKDFHDIWFLSRSFDFKGETLKEAIEKTFKARNTPVIDGPAIFDSSFMKDGNKQAQWLGFIRRAKLDSAPASFRNIATNIKLFLQPVMASIINRQTLHLVWPPSGPWHK